MTIAASRIIADCQRELQDEDGVRWPAAELVGYLNDGQHLTVTLNRGASAKNDVLTWSKAWNSKLQPAWPRSWTC